MIYPWQKSVNNPFIQNKNTHYSLGIRNLIEHFEKMAPLFFKPQGYKTSFSC